MAITSGQCSRASRTGLRGLAVVGGDRHAGAVAVRGDQPRPPPRHPTSGWSASATTTAPTSAASVRAWPDRRGARARRAARREEPMPVRHVRVVYSMCSAELDRGRAGDDQDRVRAAGPQQLDAALGEGLPVQLDERLRLAEPGPFSRGEQHPRDRRAHGPQAYARPRRPRGGSAEELVVDAALGVGQRLAGAAPAELDQLGGDRHRRLLRRPGTRGRARSASAAGPAPPR